MYLYNAYIYTYILMYMFSRHLKLDFWKKKSFISGLECLEKLQ